MITIEKSMEYYLNDPIYQKIIKLANEEFDKVKDEPAIIIRKRTGCVWENRYITMKEYDDILKEQMITSQNDNLVKMIREKMK